MELWAQAQKTINSSDANVDITLATEVITKPNAIPIILTDQNNL